MLLMCANRRSMRQWDAVSNASNLWASLLSWSLCLQCRLRRPKSPPTITMPWRLLTTLMAFDHHEPTHRRSCSLLSDSGAPPPNHPSTMQASSRRGGLNPSMRFSIHTGKTGQEFKSGSCWNLGNLILTSPPSHINPSTCSYEYLNP